MRALVKKDIAMFVPQGFLDGNSTSAFLTIEDIEATKNLKVDMVLVSLKKVIFFNKNGLDVFVKMFAKVRAANNATVGFCDYDKKKIQCYTYLL